jgi:cobalt/nickel transport protein
MSPRGRLVTVVLGASAVLAGASAWIASSFPDGLEKVAEHLGFGEKAAATPALKAPLPDYSLPALGNTPWSGALAGIAGVLITFTAAWLVGKALSRRKRAARLH